MAMLGLRTVAWRNGGLSTILMFVRAKKRKKRKAIETLLGSPAEVNSPDSLEWTPLLKACVSKPLGVVQATIAVGADVNKGDDEGFRPLMCASSGGRADVINVLLQHGAEVDAVDDYGRTALSWVVTKGDYTEAAKALISAGADVNHADAGGFTPLMRAALLNNVRCFELLVRHGAEARVVHPEWHKTALEMATERGSEALKAIAGKLRTQQPGFR